MVNDMSSHMISHVISHVFIHVISKCRMDQSKVKPPAQGVRNSVYAGSRDH